MRTAIETTTTPANGQTVESDQLLNIQFVGDRVLVEPFPFDEYINREQNIKKPVGYVEPFAKGSLQSIGSGEYGQPIPASLQVGKSVLYWHQQAIDYVIGGKVYHMVRATDVFALV